MPVRDLVCKECGQPFQADSHKFKYCNRDHYRKCEVCGNMYLVPHAKLSTVTHVCSEECRRLLIGTHSKQMQPRFKCTCSICGQTFLSKSKIARVCNSQHTFTCAYCGKQFTTSHQQALNNIQTCSDECRYALSTKHFLEDVDSHVQKMQKTMLEKYGQTNAARVPELVEKSKATCLARYGVERFCQSSEFKDKCIDTNRTRYGADWHAQTQEHKDSMKATCLARYGVDNPGKAGAYIVDKMTCPDKLEALIEFHRDPEGFISAHFDEVPTLAQVGELCGIRDSSVGDILARSGHKDLVKYSYSHMEDEVFEFLTTFLDKDEIIRTTRQVITPQELDIYLPNYKFAIECNPTVTHNSTTCIFDHDDAPKSRTYHQLKTNKCEEIGIELFHLFGYDWSYHKEVCKSMIKNRLGFTETTYYARKLRLAYVPSTESYQFLENNHRQGGVHCKVCIGLYDNADLVSLMTFSKLRNTIGQDRNTDESCWELVRFCSKLNSKVVGGASKLLKHFIQEYHPKEIRSFSDRAHTSGSLYTVLNFTKLRSSDPGYVWVDVKTDRAYSRNNAQRKNIANFLHDPDIDLTKSETQLMAEHGFVQVFDSGTITWQLLLKGDDVH